MADQLTTGGAVIGSAAACIEFWEAAADKGWFNSSSSRAVRTAFGKVMEIDDGWEAVDLRTLDRDDQFDRFRTLKSNEYSDGSLKVYRSRFNMAVKTYLARNDGDADWKSYGPSSRDTSTTRAKPKPKKTAPKVTPAANATPATQQNGQSSGATQTPPAGAANAGTIPHVFPLRHDLDVTLSLPRDLTKDEADWLGSFIATLARPAKTP